MDMSWVDANRASVEYRIGVHIFVDHIFKRDAPHDKVLCPCVRHRTAEYLSRTNILDDLFEFGIDRGYRLYKIPEDLDSISQANEATNNDMEDFMDDVTGSSHGYNNLGGETEENNPMEDSDDMDMFTEILGSATQKLYPGCEKFSTLSFIVKLLHIKCLNNWSIKSVKMLLALLSEVLPEGHNLPSDYNKCQKVIRTLGLEYVKIDACVNDCILYWRDNASKTHCPTCGSPRWNDAKKKIPEKSLRYFPLKSRLQRLFMSKKTAGDMRWHHNRHLQNEVLSHPADSEAWKKFDENNPIFSSEPRNVRLGLASDGMNPYGSMSVSYSVWPVVLIPYNLPPWLCMKQTNFILSMIIPGRTAPNNNIDVYLKPLIEELKELWDPGVVTYDAATKENFQLRAALMWTINDFPAYANLSGWSTKGKLACPVCNVDITSKSLPFSGKICYMGHRRFLPIVHRWRRLKGSFDGTIETRSPPRKFSGFDLLQQLQQLQPVTFGKNQKNPKYLNWKKRSIFFELPYWSSNMLRHNLDVMHIEKNVSEIILGTLMNNPDKTKDKLDARLDLQSFGLRKELHPTKNGDRFTYPAACYTMDANQKRKLCEFLMGVRFPDSYSSNISRCVKLEERKIMGLKSHDYHILLQQLLPIAIRDILPQNVSEAILELGNFFKELCSKNLKIDVLQNLEKQIVLTLCKLEMIFPPAFFVSMMHLPVHLATEARIGGPVQFRWMYPIERYMHTLKSHNHNKAHPEGSIAEGYIADECLTFCSRYLVDIETRFNRPERNYDGGRPTLEACLSIFSYNGRPVSAGQPYELANDEREQAHFYILQNCKEVSLYIHSHIDEIKQSGIKNVAREHMKKFSKWFEQRVIGADVTDDLKLLAHGPLQEAKHYHTYSINGFKFTTAESEKNRKTQNSGVCVKGDGASGSMEYYYGVVQHIIELRYSVTRCVVVFKCKWFNISDLRNGYRKRNGLESINLTRIAYANEPFVLASQASQVFYIKEIANKNWSVVIRTQPRNCYIDNVGEILQGDDEAYQQVENLLDVPIQCRSDIEAETLLARNDIPALFD